MIVNVKTINVKQVLMLVTIVGIGCLVFFSLIEFFADFLGALIIYVLSKPLMYYLIDNLKWKRGLAALAVMLLTVIIVVGPLILLFNVFIPKLQHLFSDTSIITHTLKNIDENVYGFSGQRLLNPDNLIALQAGAADYIKSFLGKSVSVLGDIGIMLLFLFYLLKNIGKIEQFLWHLIPVNKKNINLFTAELKAQTLSNVLGAPVLAALQGIVAGIGYWMLGLDEPFFWGIITGVFSFIPMVGGALIWLPFSIFLYSQNEPGKAILLIAYGTLVISMIDNVLRFMFQKKFADVHPLITVMGIILGIQLFGLPGMIFGPLLISYFLILAKIYKEEYIDEIYPENIPPENMTDHPTN